MSGERFAGFLAHGIYVARVTRYYNRRGVRVFRLHRTRHGAFGIADLRVALLDSGELGRFLVEGDVDVGLAAAHTEGVRDDVHHVRVALVRLHEKAASGARPHVAAAAKEEFLYLLVPFPAEILRNYPRIPARHDQKVGVVERACAYRRAVDRRRRGVLCHRCDFKPAVNAHPARTVAYEYGHLERGFCETSKCGRSRCEYQYCLFHSQL